MDYYTRDPLSLGHDVWRWTDKEERRILGKPPKPRWNPPKARQKAARKRRRKVDDK